MAGAAACLVTTALFVGLLVGVGDMMWAAPGAMLGYVAAVCLGVLVWLRG